MKRILYFDLLRFLAISAVVLLHSADQPLYDFHENKWAFATGDVYDSLCRWCVPVFIMISGALLLKTNKKETTKDFFKKRTMKVLIPFIVWSIIFVLYRHFVEGDYSYKEGVKDFLNGGVFFHLWFVYMILGLYLMTPLFRVYVAHAKRDNIEYFLLLWFIASFVPVVNDIYDLQIPDILTAVSGYVGFFILGYYLHVYHQTRRFRTTIYVLGIIAFFVTILGTFYVTANNGQYDSVFYRFLRPNVIMMALSVFLLAQQANLSKLKEDSPMVKWIILLSEASFGVYLIHPIFRDWLFKYIDITVAPIVLIPLVALILIVFCNFLIMLIQRVPLIKKIVP